jgi:serine/threonine-protein kinase CLA4
VEAAGTIFEIKRTLNGQSTNPGDDDGISRTLQIKVKGDGDLYEWTDYIYARCPGMVGVSNPTKFRHSVHVGFDPNTGEFVGLPPEMVEVAGRVFDLTLATVNSPSPYSPYRTPFSSQLQMS